MSRAVWAQVTGHSDRTAFSVIAHTSAGALTDQLLAQVNPGRHTDRAAEELGAWPTRRQTAPAPWSGSWGLLAALSVRVMREPATFATWSHPAVRAVLWPTRWREPGSAPEGMVDKGLVRWVLLDAPDHALSDALLQTVTRLNYQETGTTPEWDSFSQTYRTLRQDPTLADELDRRWWAYAQKHPESVHTARVFLALADVWHDHPDLPQRFPHLVAPLSAAVRHQRLLHLPASPTGGRRPRS